MAAHNLNLFIIFWYFIVLSLQCEPSKRCTRFCESNDTKMQYATLIHHGCTHWVLNSTFLSFPLNKTFINSKLLNHLWKHSTTPLIIISLNIDSIFKDNERVNTPVLTNVSKFDGVHLTVTVPNDTSTLDTSKLKTCLQKLRKVMQQKLIILTIQKLKYDAISTANVSNFYEDSRINDSELGTDLDEISDITDLTDYITLSSYFPPFSTIYVSLN